MNINGEMILQNFMDFFNDSNRLSCMLLEM